MEQITTGRGESKEWRAPDDGVGITESAAIAAAFDVLVGEAFLAEHFGTRKLRRNVDLHAFVSRCIIVLQLVRILMCLDIGNLHAHKLHIFGLDVGMTARVERHQPPTTRPMTVKRGVILLQAGLAGTVSELLQSVEEFFKLEVLDAGV